VTYQEAIQFLYGLRLFGAKFGLENTFQLAKLAGNPQKQLQFIHIAGTNGKGSTCAMLESIYRHSGRRVGLFTSPHLNSFRERIQVNRELIPEGDIVRLVTQQQPWLQQFAVDHHPTFFEVVTVLALQYFVQQKCEIVIWETGLGGRLDATNIVTPLACAITNIALDHQQWLGDTLEKIAGEKAGIIKPRIPAATTTTESIALEVIAKTARQQGAPLRIITATDRDALLKDIPQLSLAGEHQKINAALALAVVDLLKGQFPVKCSQIKRALAQVYWAGRLQSVTLPSNQEVLLDGAHNEAGAEMLRNALQTQSVRKERTIILGILQDKNWNAICHILAPLAEQIFIVPIQSERSSSPDALATVCREANSRAKVQVFPSFEAAFAAATGQGLVVITGSLYLIGEAMEILGIAADNNKERTLNEWTGLSHPR
jgi:dihydrofolate synthase/folylpolyglutamate synthase